MVARVIPHFDFPFRLDGHGRPVTVDQDTTDEIAACVAVAIITPRGWRPERPDFGTTDMAFLTDRGVAEAVALAEQSEPRARIATDDHAGVTDGVTRRLRMEVRS